MQESMSDRRFLGLPVRELEALGLDPRRRIVPLWFGCRAALAAVPSSCPIEVSGRSQFKLFINGVSVHFGPCRSAREVAYVDSLDIAPWLRAGENRLAMQVFSYPGAAWGTWTWRRKAPGGPGRTPDRASTGTKSS